MSGGRKLGPGTKVKPGGFVEYGPDQLPKVNAMRTGKSQPDFHGIPIIHADNVTYTSESELKGRPASCYVCSLHNTPNNTCMLMGPTIEAAKVTSEGIEYWPRCSEFNAGEEHAGTPIYLSERNPEALGLVWVNAPQPGLAFSGSNCGGCNDGDDCDHYIVESGEKWDNPTGFCRLLQSPVSCGDYCAGWLDDDILEWQEATMLLNHGGSEENKKKDFARSLVGKDVTADDTKSSKYSEEDDYDETA